MNELLGASVIAAIIALLLSSASGKSLSSEAELETKCRWPSCGYVGGHNNLPVVIIIIVSVVSGIIFVLVVIAIIWRVHCRTAHAHEATGGIVVAAPVTVLNNQPYPRQEYMASNDDTVTSQPQDYYTVIEANSSPAYNPEWSSQRSTFPHTHGGVDYIGFENTSLSLDDNELPPSYNEAITLKPTVQDSGS